MKRKRNSKIISLLLAVMMILSSLPVAGISALAATSGGFEYEILSDGTAEITGYTGSAETLEIPSTLNGYTVTSIGEMAFYSCDSLTSVTIPDSVTSIGESAFYSCVSLTSITIPDSVTSIGECAFGYCNSLTNITVNENNKNYSSQDGVLFDKEKTELIQYPTENERTSYSIPDGVTSIGEMAFAYCDSLTSVTIPNGVTSIGKFAFCYCDSLTNITIPESVTIIDVGAFQSCSNLTSITIPDLVTSIGSSAFVETGYYDDDANWENGVLYIGNHLIEANPDEIPSVYTINEGTITIADIAFEFCNSLTSITIPNSVASIGTHAFGWCDNLTSVDLGSGVTGISDMAFSFCENLTGIAIPDSVASIGIAAFAGCYSLTNINVDENNKAYFSQDGVLFNKEKTELIQYPAGSERTSYSIPNSVTSIGYGAFVFCENLTDVTIPNSVTSIGYSAFEGTGYYNDDTNWENGVLYIGNHLIKANSDEIPSEYSINEETVNIADSAFEFCDSLTSVTIADSVTSIGDDAFGDCESLTSVTIPDSVTSIGNYAFASCYSLTSITIPESVTSIGDDAFYDSALETIYGYENSYAQTYAEENGYEFISIGSVGIGMFGDVNGDWKINALDVLIVKRYIAKYEDAKLEGDQFALADVSGDGKVNAKDALAIMQKIAKLITSFDEIK